VVWRVRALSEHRNIEELLEGLTVEGSPQGTGAFTIAPDQVWKGLGHAVSGLDELPRFALRWLTALNPRHLEVIQKSTRLSFTAHLATSPPPEQPNFDYSGKDIDLARFLVCVQKSGGKDMLLTIQGPNVTWSGSYPNQGASDWKKESGAKTCLVRLEFTASDKKVLSAWKKSISERFKYCPVRLDWQGSTVNVLYEFETPALIWRRLVPHSNEQAKLNFRAPESSLAEYVRARTWNSELIMSLSTHRTSRLKFVYNGDLFHIERPGFLPGFEIIVNADGISLDMQGTQIVENQTFKNLLQIMRDEAYDMFLQLYHIDPPPSRQVLCNHLVALESVLVYLLIEKRFVEGASLVDWLHEHLNNTLPERSPEESYTFLRTAALHCENANRPHLAMRFAKQAQKVLTESRMEFAVEAALVDAHLEAKSRVGKPEALTHHTSSHLHVLAVRCQNSGDFLQAFRLLYALLTSHRTISQEKIDLWFQAAELARDLRKREHLKKLLRLLKRSDKQGTVTLSTSVRARANTFADLVSK
jgi:hypothetical protein